MINSSLDSTLAAYLELLAAAEQPGFSWGPAELRVAFQWADTLQQLVDRPESSAAIRARLQVRRLPSHRPLRCLPGLHTVMVFHADTILNI